MASDLQDYYNTNSIANWSEAFNPLMNNVVVAGSKAWALQLGVKFDLRHVLAEDWFRDYSLQFAQPVSATTAKNVHEIIGQAQAEGWTMGQIEKSIDLNFRQYKYGDVSKRDWAFIQARLPAHRVEMIARTETIRAANAGSNELYKVWNLEEREWSSAHDNRVRDDHLHADGQVKPLKEPFQIGGYQMMYPGDASLGAPPSEFINCRCTTLPVITAKQKETIQEIAQAQAIELEAAKYDISKYHEFPDNYHYKDEYTEWANKQDAIAKALPDDEFKAVRYYTGTGYEQMNAMLRGYGPSDDGTQGFIDKVDRALGKNHVSEGFVGYRGVAKDAFKDIFTPGKTDINSLIGMVYEDKGFTSISINKQVAEGFASGTNKFIIKVLVPEDSPAMYVDTFSKHQGEYEYVLSRGIRFEIVEARTEKTQTSEGFEYYKNYITVIAHPIT